MAGTQRRVLLVVTINLLLEFSAMAAVYFLGGKEYFAEFSVRSIIVSGQPIEIFLLVSGLFFIISLVHLMGIFFGFCCSRNDDQSSCCHTSNKCCSNIRIIQATVMVANGTGFLIHSLRTKRVGDCESDFMCSWAAGVLVGIVAIIDGLLYLVNWEPALPTCLLGKETDVDELVKADKEGAKLERYTTLSSGTESGGMTSTSSRKSSYSHPYSFFKDSKDPIIGGFGQDVVVLKIESQSPLLVGKDRGVFSAGDKTTNEDSSDRGDAPALESDDLLFYPEESKEYFLPQFQRQSSRGASDADDNRYSTLIRQLRNSGIFG